MFHALVFLFMIIASCGCDNKDETEITRIVPHSLDINLAVIDCLEKELGFLNSNLTIGQVELVKAIKASFSCKASDQDVSEYFKMSNQKHGTSRCGKGS